jgi:hypothetical protein
MDFKLVLKKLLTDFKEKDIRYALMGGFALGLLGCGRTTVDMDFLVNRDDMEKVDAIMNVLDYKCKYRSENVSQYVSSLKIFGEVDFLHAFRKASLQMIENAMETDVFEGSLKVRVLRPEDIIGLKLQAMKNNPSRKQREIEDIKLLFSIHKNKIDLFLIKKYTEILDMEDLYNEIFRQEGNEAI